MGENKAIKAGIGYTVANYLIKGLSFFTLPIFTRLLSTKDFGVYNTFLAYENILTIILGMAFSSSFNVARFKFKINRYVSCCISVSFIFSLFILGIIDGIYPLYNRILNMDRWMITLLVLFSFSSAVVTFYNSYIGLEFQYKKFVIISALGAIGNIVLSLLLILTLFSGNRGLGRIIGMSLSSISLSVYIIIFFFSKEKPCFEKDYIKFALRYCIPIIPHSLSQIILNQFDRIMISSMCGENEAGIYSFAYTLFSILLITITSLDKVWAPWFFDNLKANNYLGIKKRSSQYALVMASFSALLILIAPEIIRFLGSKEYWGSVYCVAPIIVGGYFSFLYYIPCQVEYYYEKTQYIALGSIFAAGLNIVLNIFFIKQYGYVAAAYTTLLSYFLYFVFHYVISIIIVKKRIFHTGKIVILSIGVLLVAIIETTLMDYPIIRWGLAAVMCLLLFNGGIKYLNKYHKKERVDV